MSIPAPRACFLACIAGWAIGGCTPADPLDPTPDPSTTGPPSPSTVPSDTTSTPSMPDPTAGPYPIVLAHGFFGFDDFAGLSFINYFWQVRDTLEDAGEPWVFTPAVDPYNDSWIRGGQLAVEVDAILEATGAQKVNLIGHSQGGLDARVVAHLYPEKVASVTTIATPHGGTQIADLALMVVPDSDAQDVIDWLLATFGMAAYDDFGNETSLFAALYQYSHEGITAFNAEFTDQPQVHYYSLTGRTDWHLGGTDCDAPDAPPFVTAWDAEVDRSTRSCGRVRSCWTAGSATPTRTMACSRSATRSGAPSWAVSPQTTSIRSGR